MAKQKSKKTRSKLKKDTLKQEENVFTMVKQGLKSPQMPLVVGVFLFLFAVFCLISFISFFITTAIDYDSVKNLCATDLITGEQNIGNWGGKLGAYISYLCITHTFGIGAFGFILLLILFSLRLLKVQIPLFSKWIVATIVIMLWASSVMGFIVVVFEAEVLENFAGIVGISVNQALKSLIGNIGCGFVLLAFTITIPMILFGVKYLWVRNAVKSITQHKEEQEDEEEISDNESNKKEDNKTTEKGQKDPTQIKQSLFSRLFKKKTQKETSQTKEITSNTDEKEKSQEQNTSTTHSEPIILPINHTPTANTFTQQDVDEQASAIKVRYIDDSETVLNTNSLMSETKNLVSHTNLTNNDTQETLSQTNVSDSENETPNDAIDNTETSNIPFTVKTTTDIPSEEQTQESNEIVSPIHHSIEEPYDPYENLSHYKFPTTDFLIDYDKNNTVISEKELIANKNRIEATLLNYQIKISSIEATVGPTVTLYEIIPAPGIRISKIKSLEDDIALSLSALGIRIIAPIPGKGTIGIEVPNSKPQVVSMKSMLESPQFLDNKFELPVAIGKRIDNTPYVADLAKMPHLLMAGATGQGKSVGLNAIISSLLYKKHPCDLKFIFVDPKKVELSLYSKLEKHYLAKVPNGKEAVITDVKDVVYTLRSLCQLMDTRYELLKQAGCKKITEYNKKFIARRLNPEKGHNYMPYIVVVIDEFADLIMTAGKEIERPICRLAQLARAVGIHLIIATQRPSVNIITGTIKANFPARAAFKVSSLTDSRTILDTKGAEQLIGRGDMLISNGGGLIRLQCALIDTEEIEQVADFIAEQQGFDECFLLPEVKEDCDADENTEKRNVGNERDALFEDAARVIVMAQQGSTSLLQRKLSLGYNRAGRIMDQLENAGIVGPFRGSKARDVLISTEEELNNIINCDKNIQTNDAITDNNFLDNDFNNLESE